MRAVVYTGAGGHEVVQLRDVPAPDINTNEHMQRGRDLTYDATPLPRELVDLGSDMGIVEKSGAWYSFNGDRIGQGRDSAKEFLIEKGYDPTVFNDPRIPLLTMDQIADPFCPCPTLFRRQQIASQFTQ